MLYFLRVVTVLKIGFSETQKNEKNFENYSVLMDQSVITKIGMIAHEMQEYSAHLPS